MYTSKVLLFNNHFLYLSKRRLNALSLGRFLIEFVDTICINLRLESIELFYKLRFIGINKKLLVTCEYLIVLRTANYLASFEKEEWIGKIDPTMRSIAFHKVKGSDSHSIGMTEDSPLWKGNSKEQLKEKDIHKRAACTQV